MVFFLFCFGSLVLVRGLWSPVSHSHHVHWDNIRFLSKIIIKVGGNGLSLIINLIILDSNFLTFIHLIIEFFRREVFIKRMKLCLANLLQVNIIPFFCLKIWWGHIDGLVPLISLSKFCASLGCLKLSEIEFLSLDLCRPFLFYSFTLLGVDLPPLQGCMLIHLEYLLGWLRPKLVLLEELFNIRGGPARGLHRSIPLVLVVNQTQIYLIVSIQGFVLAVLNLNVNRSTNHLEVISNGSLYGHCHHLQIILCLNFGDSHRHRR